MSVNVIVSCNVLSSWTQLISVLWRMLNFTGTLCFLNKNVVFPVHAEYPYFSANFRLKY